MGTKRRPLQNYQKPDSCEKPFLLSVENTIKAPFPSTGSREETPLISNDTLANLHVTNLKLSLPNLKPYLSEKVQSFKGGQLVHCISKWKEITSDSEVLNCVQGKFTEFSTQPTKHRGPMKKTFSPSDSLVIEAEIQKLLSDGVIVPTQHEGGE